MGKILIPGSSGGGVSSDDVTASKAQVLQGYRTITSDSNDEVAEGEIVSVDTGANNFRINKSNAYGIDNWTDVNNPTFYIDLPHGNAFYNRPDGHPHVCIDAEKLGNATADRVVAGSTFTSKSSVAVQGQIADRGEGGVVSFAQGREDWASRMWVTFKNGWYHRAPHPQGHESYVYITYEQLKDLFGIDASKMLQGYSVAGVQGAIQRWICNTGDVITALGGEGFAWDDTYANRGRGIVAKIPKDFFIQDANWVFLPSPNLYPQNVAKNVNINGVTGTRDYIDLITPTWLSDTTLNLHVNIVEKEIHIPNKFPQYNGLFLKVIIWGSILDGYYKDSNGGACPCVLAVTNWDGGANFTVKVGAAMFYGTLERQGNGFNDFKLTYRGSTAFNLSLNFLITEGFSHQWAGSYAT